MRLRRHQREALDAIAASEDQRHWVVLPPGAGKTLVGVSAALRWGRPVVVFGPNLAIVEQWRQAWEDVAGGPTSSDRTLPTRFTALTYQSLAVFDAESDAVQGTARLHPNGIALVERLHEAGPITLILDECHHLLQVWGALLDDIVSGLPDAQVLALTATPPALLTPVHAQRVGRLFGSITYQAGIPALVAEGGLAPFAELAWFTTPTAPESAWLDARALRASELVTELLRTDGAGIPLLTWLALHDGRDLPRETADAAVRLALAGHLDLPEHAHVAERHRRPPTLEDWLLLASGWLMALREGTEPERERARRLGGLLPGVGFRLTRHGIVAGQPLVDRVLSRSAAKTLAAAEIVAQTLAEDPDARLLVLTDHASAAALPADVDGVLAPESGSVRWLLETFVADPRIAGARPVGVTGSSIGAQAEVMAHLLPGLAGTSAGSEVVVIEGTSAGWLRAATRALESGWTRVLIGTRGLLGEGWDARSVTGVIDLTSATTSTAIVQTRGRSLRTDPARPDKVAVNWTVTCVASERPQGDADYRRLVRKHAGWFSVDEYGDVVEGPAHLDSTLGPDLPPQSLPNLNARALSRSADAEGIRAAWARVSPDRVNAVATLRVSGRRAPHPLPVLTPVGTRTVPLSVLVVGVVAAVVGGLAGGSLWPAALVVTTICAVLAGVLTRRRAVAMRAKAVAGPSLRDFGAAVADALQERGLSPRGAEGVTVSVAADGETRIRLDVPPGIDDDAAASQVFAEALDEVLGVIEHPRYLVSRPGWEDRAPRWYESGSPRPDTEIWHQVPAVLGVNRAGVDAFLASWHRHVGPGEVLFTGSPEGAGALRALRWSSPFGDAAGLTVRHRTQW